MFKSFLISIFAILLFTLGGAASWFYVQMVAEESTDDEFTPQVAFERPGDANPVPQFDSLGKGGALPAVFRGPELDPAEMFRLGVATKAKQEQLHEYEERLREHKLRIKAADADTKSAQREVEGTLNQIRSLITDAERLLGETKTSIAELKKTQAETNQKTDALKDIQDKAAAGVANEVKRFAEILQSMPAEDAAEMIKEMANDGKIDFAIQLLRNIEPRNASDILAEIEDPSLVAEFASRYTEAPQLR